jgi:hypothetical protein
MDLAQTTGMEHLDAEASALQLLRPGAGREKDQLELVAPILGSAEHSLEHRLGAPQPLTPRHSYENPHASAQQIIRSA